MQWVFSVVQALCQVIHVEDYNIDSCGHGPRRQMQLFRQRLQKQLD